MLNLPSCKAPRPGIHQVQMADIAALRDAELVSASDDMDDVLLISVAKGPQPTPGYGHSLSSSALLDGELRIRLHWRTPAKDAILAQVVTHPCLVLGIVAADARRVVVSDETGELGVLPIP